MLRRLAARCIRIHGRQRGKGLALSAYDDTLAVRAAAYVELYDALRQAAKLRMKERREGKAAIEELVRAIRSWAPIVARDIDDVRAGEFGENPAVPDDAIRDGKGLLKYGSEHVDREGQPLSYADALKEDLGGAVETAEAEWGEAEQAQEGYAALRAQVLETGILLEQDLVAYRKTLKSEITSAHPDYQKLRIDRIRTPDEDDDEVAAALPEDLPEETETTPVAPENQPTSEAQASP
jgi:hypothetical protein